MITYLASEDFNLIEGYLCEKLNCELLNTLLNSSLPITRVKLTIFFDLGQEINTEGNIFEEATTDFLIDIDKLEITEKDADYINKLLEKESTSQNYFFYSSIEGGLNATTKKIWQKAGAQIVDLKKPDEDIKTKLAIKYTKLLGLEIAQTSLSLICKQARNYREVLDNLDFVDLANNQNEAINSILVEEDLQMFMLGFDLAKIEQSVQRWYKKVPEEDLQFALSLMFGKIEKQNIKNKKIALTEVILADKNIKTRSKISPNTWWKLCLWNIQRKIIET